MATPPFSGDDAMTGFSWNLVADLREMWSLPFMVSAFRAGTIVAVLAALIGWFMVLRRQSFAGHTLAVVGFPGAAAAAWLGVSLTHGYYAGCVAAALVISLGSARRGHTPAAASAVVGIAQAFALAAGMLLTSLSQGFLNSVSSLLFGSFLGITPSQVNTLVVVAVGALAVLAVIGRPLLFSSVDAGVASAHGVPTRLLGTVFLVLLGVTAAAVSQITGALLVFSLLVLPPATAARLTSRTGRGLALSVGLGLVVVWVALFVAFYSPYPVGFWLTTIAFGLYVSTLVVTRLRERLARRAAEAVT